MILLQQLKSATKEKPCPIFVASEQGLDASVQANIQTAATKDTNIGHGFSLVASIWLEKTKVIYFHFQPHRLFFYIQNPSKDRTPKDKYSRFVAWEQRLDASAQANIQPAATKVTNREYLSFGVRPVEFNSKKSRTISRVMS